ncbi:hypothetical protein LJC18_01675 [Lachnospiraceae bacterium OttesenSCG-928-E19]|nr:hypothetical protein [Lachnospiraceae bacterium OttesenSCG-928-E19]
MKKCLGCGSEINEEEKVCKNCGAKQIQERNTQRKLIVAICIILALAISGGTGFYFYSQHQKELKVEKIEEERLAKEQEEQERLAMEEEERKQKEAEEQAAAEEEKKLQSYVGEWQEGTDDVYQIGGAVLTVDNVEEGYITFSVVKVSSSQKIAETNVITAPIIDNSVEFTWEDSFENNGGGSLIFKEDSIIANLVEKSNGGNGYSVAMDVQLSKNIEPRYGEGYVVSTIKGTPPEAGTYIQGSAAPFVVISNVTDTAFDFEIFEVGGSTMFKHHTAKITDVGRAVYDGEKYYLTFDYGGGVLEIWGFDLIGNPGWFELVRDYAN